MCEHGANNNSKCFILSTNSKTLSTNSKTLNKNTSEIHQVLKQGH
jgi:hypothetical protein